MARLRPDQWADIQAAWIGTDKPIRELAREFGVNEKAIRDKAEKEAWGPRNASSRKREMVAARLAGSQQTPRETPQCGEGADPAISEADADIEVMRFSGKLFVKILHRADSMLDLAADGRELNSIADASKKALDGYRRVRGLDEPTDSGKATVSPYSHMTDEELAAKIRESEAR